uniref:Uncharacterized protein n=1 Tax=Meloidogyne enterolobii TaxID=390850 RepID=A0A6V7U4E1_MELEN|nr:unnamed protein product [Meloidogyne enterolobii]
MKKKMLGRMKRRKGGGRGVKLSPPPFLPHQSIAVHPEKAINCSSALSASSLPNGHNNIKNIRYKMK